MSVTFWAPDAPTITVKPYPKEEPDYVEERSTLPEINFSNCNAREMLQLIGLDSATLCGTLRPEEFGPVVARLQKLLNSEKARAPAVKKTSELDRRVRVLPASEQSPGNVVRIGIGPRIIDVGRSDDSIKRRARNLLDLFVQARQANYQASWG